MLLLADHYIASFGKRLRKNLRGVQPEVAAAFRRYEWPGNVRELRNVIERALILEDDDVITMKYVRRTVAEGAKLSLAENGMTAGAPAHFRLPAEGLSLEAVELGLVSQAITRSHGNQTKAAVLLDISRDQLRYRLKKLEVARSAN